MEILIPSPAIRNLIREDKVHQIYGMMQAGQAKHGMQTFNQSLAALYFKRMITLETALARSSYPDELQEIINRGPASMNPTLTALGEGDRGCPASFGKDEPAPVRPRKASCWRTRATPRWRCCGASRSRSPASGSRGARSSSCRACRGASARKRIAIFTRQFSVMLDAGLPLVQCLEILGEQEEHRTFQAIIQQVRTDVESGSSLADSMRKHPKAFDNLYVNMVAAGEAGGILDIILQRLSVYIEKVVRLNSQVKSALIYPAAVIVIAALVVFVILWKCHPGVRPALLRPGRRDALPDPDGDRRQQLRRANYFIFIILVVVFGSVAVSRWHKTPHGRRVLDGAMLKIPIIGMLLRKIAVARFCRTLGTLTASGVPILDGLEITAKTSGNAIIEDAVMAVRKSVEEGKTISEPLAQTKVFPAMVVQMINVGEQTGALDQMLSKIADFYEEEVDTAVAGLMKLIEPLMISILGVVIGTIVTAMYLPLYSILLRRSVRRERTLAADARRRPAPPLGCSDAPEAAMTSHDPPGASAPLVHRHPRGGHRQRPAPVRTLPALGAPGPAAGRARHRRASHAGGGQPAGDGAGDTAAQRRLAAGGSHLRRHPALHRSAAAPAPLPPGAGLHPVLRRPGADHRPGLLPRRRGQPVLAALPDRHRRGLDAAAPPRRRQRGERRLPALRRHDRRPLLRLAAAGHPGAGRGVGLAPGLQPGGARLRLLRRGPADLLPGAQA